MTVAPSGRRPRAGARRPAWTATLLAALLVTPIAGCQQPTPAPVKVETSKRSDTKSDTKLGKSDTKSNRESGTAPDRDTPATPPRARVPLCDDASAAIGRLRAAARGEDADALASAATDATIQALFQHATQRAGKPDPASYERAAAALEGATDPEDRRARALTVTGTLDLALAFWMRDQLAVGADLTATGPQRRAAWDAAACAWEQLKASPAVAAHDLRDSVGLSPSPARAIDLEIDPDAHATIAEAFARGRAALAGDSDIPDEANTVVLPARQRVEKTLYRLIYRSLVARGPGDRSPHGATGRADMTRARYAYELIKDRLVGKNTPAIATLDEMLRAASERDPQRADMKVVADAFAVAFAKRTRKYASYSLEHPELPLAERVASATEGETYVRLILPDMAARLAAAPDDGGDPFDPAAHASTWRAYVEELEAEGDEDELRRLSGELVRRNCAYQKALGIRECTSTIDEVAI